ncbi:hypothetical protein, partial [Stappia sp. MMSF_3263]|uniref:hypothetical protein n=1 Tax=Stappia sp. MMSF_3263 TaxID=3046693 RepID=UPI00273F2FF3
MTGPELAGEKPPDQRRPAEINFLPKPFQSCEKSKLHAAFQAMKVEHHSGAVKRNLGGEGRVARHRRRT